MILLCGATGDLGGRVARLLSDKGIPFRALVRPGRPTHALTALGAEVVVGDLTDPATLPSALDGVDTVITTANAISRMLGGAKDVSIAAVDRDGNRNLVDAAERAGVARFVFVSMAGLSEETAHLAPLAAAKLATERRLEASTMRRVVVRPDKFQEVWLAPLTGIDPLRSKAVIYGKGATPEAYVAEDDVAALVVALAIEPDPPTVVEFGGPERLTRNEVCDALGAAFGVTLHPRHVPRVALRVGAALLSRPKPDIASLMGMSLYSDTHPIRWDDTALTSRGITPRTTTAYVRELAAAS